MMPCSAGIVQAPGLDHQIARRPYLPCGKCHAAIEFDKGTRWGVVNNLVNDHLEACPGNKYAWHARMACTPTPPPVTAIALPPPLPPKPCAGSLGELARSTTNTNAWIPPGYERKRRTLEQRKLELERDKYTRNVKEKSVVCVGCHKEISLDKRSEYYPGLWLKHKGKCPSIEKLERSVANANASDGTHHVSCDIVLSAISGDNQLQLGPAESYSVAGTQQFVRHYDSAGLASEDEDEEPNLVDSKPFPILNGTFYREQQNKYGSGGWMYRYATEDEIMTNVFQGQDESYAWSRHSTVCPL